MFFNARSIVNKCVDFMALVSTSKLDVIGICEIYLDSSVLDSEMIPSVLDTLRIVLIEIIMVVEY